MTDLLPWVFGYGSLMWRPGFPFVEQRPAVLKGYHRQLCVFSAKHRGTAERPGLVMGLVPGGLCVGRAFRLDEREVESILAALDEREGGYPYQRTRVRVEFPKGDGAADAYAYVPDPKDKRFAGELPLAEAARYVIQGVGVSGPCVEYLRSSVLHLRALGIADERLEALLAKVERRLALAEEWEAPQ